MELWPLVMVFIIVQFNALISISYILKSLFQSSVAFHIETTHFVCCAIKWLVSIWNWRLDGDGLMDEYIIDIYLHYI